MARWPRPHAAIARRRNAAGGQPPLPSPTAHPTGRLCCRRASSIATSLHANVQPDIEGDDFPDDPVIVWLERGCSAEPEQSPTMPELSGHYRKRSRLKRRHRLADDAVRAYPPGPPDAPEPPDDADPDKT